MAKKGVSGVTRPRLALGIDPGISGAFVITDGFTFMKVWGMPLVVEGKNKSVEFDGIHELLTEVIDGFGLDHVYLERAIPMAMGSKGAFNYGRGFAAIEIAIELVRIPVTYVEPQKWAKEMHEGMSQDLKPKAKSLLAVKRLYPSLVASLPKNTKGVLLDGPVDALLIAGYGLRKGVPKRDEEVADFY